MTKEKSNPLFEVFGKLLENAAPGASDPSKTPWWQTYSYPAVPNISSPPLELINFARLSLFITSLLSDKIVHDTTLTKELDLKQYKSLVLDLEAKYTKVYSHYNQWWLFYFFKFPEGAFTIKKMDCTEKTIVEIALVSSSSEEIDKISKLFAYYE